MSRRSALRNIPQILAGCNLRTAARTPRCSQGCVALRSVLRLYVASVGTWLVPPPILCLGLPHSLLQISSGMKVFARVASQNSPRCLRMPLACGVHTSQLNEWLRSSALFFSSSLGLVFVQFSFPRLESSPQAGTRPEASPLQGKGGSSKVVEQDPCRRR